MLYTICKLQEASTQACLTVHLLCQQYNQLVMGIDSHNTEFSRLTRLVGCGPHAFVISAFGREEQEDKELEVILIQAT